MTEGERIAGSASCWTNRAELARQIDAAIANAALEAQVVALPALALSALVQELKNPDTCWPSGSFIADRILSALEAPQGTALTPQHEWYDTVDGFVVCRCGERFALMKEIAAHIAALAPQRKEEPKA